MKKIIIIILITVLSIGALIIFSEYIMYKAKNKERRKTINEIYQLYNKDNTKNMHDALLKTCIGDTNKLGSYAKAERKK